MSTDPIRVGHPDDPAAPEDACGCCDGTELSTSTTITNRPNLSQIEYRVGTHSAFKASMLTGLAKSEHPQLLGLGTRADTDFSIALIDAWATVCDVLSFYQDRHAQEAYVGTATERLSINEIARLIGYKLHPGSAAETPLVFLMDDPPGAEPDVADLLIPAGTRVQSQPGPDEMPQTFESLEDLQTRVGWNRLRARQSRRIVPKKDDTGTWLDGLPTLQVGEGILIVGAQRGDPLADDFGAGSELWDFRRVLAVEPDPDLNKTFVRWDRPLGSNMPFGLPAQLDHRFYVLRERASLFGYNAPHPLVLSPVQRDGFGYTSSSGGIIGTIIVEAGGVADEAGMVVAEQVHTSPSLIQGSSTNVGDWDYRFRPSDEVVLDAIYQKFVPDSWIVLTRPTGLVELYRIETAQDDNEARYAISGKATRLTLDTDENLDQFEDQYRRVSVYGASEELAFADTPLTDLVGGSEVELETTAAADLPEGRLLVFTGRRPQVLVEAHGLTLTPEVGAARTLTKGNRLSVLAVPEAVLTSIGVQRWQLRDADGFEGETDAIVGALRVVPADDTAELLAETATLLRVDAADTTHSILVLKTALTHAYDRADLAIHANVAPSSHGESVSDILGGGSPRQPFQAAILKQAPVTHLVASTENGVASTLEMRIDGVRWDEVPNLYDRSPKERIFTTSLTDTGETIVRFGDGISGARPPAGRDNIQASYRRDLGLGGNVRAGQLVLPLDRPLGLRDVTNPLPATGGADAEVTEDARRNAPIYTLTLGRVVSVTDYRDFALGFPGIAKADARWVWQGTTRRVVVTVAGDDGADIPIAGPVYSALLDAYRQFGDPLVTFDLLTFEPVSFRLGLRVAVDAAYINDDVLAGVEAALRTAYSFDARDFAQPVALSDVVAQAHSVAGVVAVDVDRLYRDVAPQSGATDHRLLISQTGRRADDGTLLAGEILTLSPDPFDTLEVMA